MPKATTTKTAPRAKTLTHVNEIAMEQAKHRGPQS
jgi:hypothetical protein